MARSPDARSVEDDLMSRHHAFRVISGSRRRAADPVRLDGRSVLDVSIAPPGGRAGLITQNA